MSSLWPDNKKFAFTIIDDTDNAVVDNISPVYELLTELGMKTTKTIWSFPSRNHFRGESLQDPLYLAFIKDLSLKGFEIALHNVGSGHFTRDEIVSGLKVFKDLLGSSPDIHINHSSNHDNIYWGYERYGILLKNLMRLVYGKKHSFYGHDLNSDCFWGDLCKANIRYIRNRVFMGIDTLAYDPFMPYKEKSKDAFSNYWFSSSDGHTVEEFNQLLDSKNVDRLVKNSSACIVYTHFANGFVDQSGKVDKVFKERLQYLAAQDGWFVPATQLLDYLNKQRNSNEYVSQMYLLKMDFQWLLERVYKKIVFGR